MRPRIESATEFVNGLAVDDQQLAAPKKAFPIRKSVRLRNKAHLAFVAAQPCLIYARSPADAHHIKFAQPTAMGRKVSDEFTVPLCREHHQALHRHGNERSWWANLQVAPLEIAGSLWRTSPIHGSPGSLNPTTPAPRVLDQSNRSEQ
jgi:hypothetical protein